MKASGDIVYENHETNNSQQNAAKTVYNGRQCDETGKQESVRLEVTQTPPYTHDSPKRATIDASKTEGTNA